MAYLIWQGIGLLKGKVNADVVKYAGFALGGAVILVSAVIVFARSVDWENDINLYLTDVKAVPNSAPAQMRCGVSCINLADSIEKKHVDSLKSDEHGYYLQQAISHLKKSITIYPGYGDGYINLTVAYINARQYYDAEGALAHAQELHPDHPKLKELVNTIGHILMDSAMISGGRGHFDSSLAYLKRAEVHLAGNADLYYNYGGYYYTSKNYPKAREYWEKTVKVNPTYQPAIQGLNALSAAGM